MMSVMQRAGWWIVIAAACSSAVPRPVHDDHLAVTRVADEHVVAGATHTCVVRAGEVWCWGGNEHGELGDGTHEDALAPRLVRGLVAPVAVALGEHHTCVLDAGGGVACWGGGEYGQLAGKTDSQVPVAITLPAKATQIAAGDLATCALLADARVACWGHASYGETGGAPADGDHVVPGVKDAVQLALGRSTSCVLSRDRRVTCWGGHWLTGLFGNDKKAQPPTEIPELAGADEIAVGSEHICARTGGAVRCHGKNMFGLLGDPDVACCDLVTVKVRGLADAVAIGARGAYTCAVRVTGRVLCWGDRPGADRNAPGPAEVPGLAGVLQLAAGTEHVCARVANGIACWGDNTLGQLGNGSSGKVSRPERVAIDDAVQLAVGYLHTCARRTSGAVACWGPIGNTHVPADVTVLGRASDVASGIYETCARGVDGSVRCVQRGQLEYPAGVVTLSAPPDTLRAGGGGICALTAGKVACVEEVMDAHTVPGPLPARTAIALPFRDVTQLAVGNAAVCVVGRKVACTEHVDFRERAPEDSPWQNPRYVTGLAGSDVAALAIGDLMRCALLRSGHVTCWNWSEPEQVPGLDDVVELVARSGHACARKSDGSVWCWGDNDHGQLGDGTRHFERRKEPVRVVGITGVLELGAGDAHTCARTATGVFCWGSNEDGRLGTGTVPNVEKPATVIGWPP
jgi:alpha-tubulin suppressor-like RCC1 family protein